MEYVSSENLKKEIDGFTPSDDPKADAKQLAEWMSQILTVVEGTGRAAAEQGANDATSKIAMLLS